MAEEWACGVALGVVEDSEGAEVAGAPVDLEETHQELARKTRIDQIAPVIENVD